MSINQTHTIKSKNRILLVEDEIMNMSIMSTYLRDDGYEVDEAADGVIAWGMLNNHEITYDVVITDRRMPNMDGLELAKKIKNDAALRGTPIIMQTGAVSHTEMSEGIKTGVFYYLAKPYAEETLLTLTRSAMREREKTNIFEENLSRQKNALSTIMHGIFHVQNPAEAENIALLLGSLLPRPELAVTGLYELLMNSIEHGNLNIGFQEKGKLVATSSLDSEIRRRLELPENKSKKVVVEFTRTNDGITVTITDSGEGFNWKPFIEIEPSRATQGNGRGIAKANLISFDRILYSPKGNQVQIQAQMPRM